MIKIQDNKLIRFYDGEMMQIEAWGPDSLRVRVTKLNKFTEEDWALLPPQETIPQIRFFSTKSSQEETVQANTAEIIEGDCSEIINGKIRLKIAESGKIIIYNNKDEVLLSEYEYNWNTSLKIRSRELKGMPGGNFAVSYKFNANPSEKLYGMGQYQDGVFDLKGSSLELAQRNTQASVPFVYSNLGYGFFWNNPAAGRATFGTNMTEWTAISTKQVDFWITAGDTPAEILSKYIEATGKPPVMPEYGLGFWQCKLRYQTQEEVLSIARKYQELGIPLDVIIIDFFHWPVEGAWDFNREFWPDPVSMVKELKEMGITPIVSVWPTVSVKAPNYNEMKEKGYLVRTENGVQINMLMIDPTSFVDATNPEAREYAWQRVKDTYVSYGITNFWLDVAEPEYSSPDFENYRYYKGNAMEVGNEFPVQYTKAFYEGFKKEGIDTVSLVRCAWAGSQRYAALVWSGDISSTFRSLRNQIVCGQQMAMSGIPWWNSDIGGFNPSDAEGFEGGNIEDPSYRELIIRWFQYGAFCPVMRLHGSRRPLLPAVDTFDGRFSTSGGYNEIWSYGEECFSIFKQYIGLRDRMRPYLRDLYQKSSEIGCPIIRPLFYNFPEDKIVWDIKEQYMYGDDILVAPVAELGARTKNVYLPEGTNWIDAFDGREYAGGAWYEIDAPIEKIPVLIRADKPELIDYFHS